MEPSTSLGFATASLFTSELDTISHSTPFLTVSTSFTDHLSPHPEHLSLHHRSHSSPSALLSVLSVHTPDPSPGPSPRSLSPALLSVMNPSPGFPPQTPHLTLTPSHSPIDSLSHSRNGSSPNDMAFGGAAPSPLLSSAWPDALHPRDVSTTPLFPPPPADDEDQDDGVEMDVDGEGMASAANASRSPNMRRLSSANKTPGPQNSFPQRLFRMVQDPASAPYIHWTPDGAAFVIPNEPEFSEQCLPKWWKHGKFASFVRQLNMYDFHKVNRAPRSHRGAADNHIIFRHTCFKRDRQDLVALIKRKAPDQQGLQSNGSGYPPDTPLDAASEKLNSSPPMYDQNSSPTSPMKLVLEDNAKLRSDFMALRGDYSKLEQDHARLHALFIALYRVLEKDAKIGPQLTALSPPLGSPPPMENGWTPFSGPAGVMGRLSIGVTHNSSSFDQASEKMGRYHYNGQSGPSSSRQSLSRDSSSSGSMFSMPNAPSLAAIRSMSVSLPAPSPISPPSASSYGSNAPLAADLNGRSPADAELSSPEQASPAYRTADFPEVARTPRSHATAPVRLGTKNWPVSSVPRLQTYPMHMASLPHVDSPVAGDPSDTSSTNSYHSLGGLRNMKAD